MTVLFEHPRLRVLAEYPTNWKCQSLSSVADCVTAMTVAGLDFVGVFAERYGKVGMSNEQRIRTISFHGVTHRRTAEGVDDSGVTGSASRSWRFLGALLRHKTLSTEQP